MLFIILILIVLVLIYLVFTKRGLFLKPKNKINLKQQDEKIGEISNIVAEAIINKKDNEDIDTDDIESFFSDDNENIENFFNSNDDNLSNVKSLLYLDVSINNNRGRIILEMANDVTPKTCSNFRTLCKKKKYVNTRFHRVIKDFMIQGGDIDKNDGTGGHCIWGNKFDDENFVLKHERGVISMANGGPNTNGSQFFITTKKTDWLDGKHTVFGKVIKGMDIVDYISNVEVDDKKLPKQDIVILDSGIL